MTVVRGRTITPTNIDTILAECDPTEPTWLIGCHFTGMFVFDEQRTLWFSGCTHTPEEGRTSMRSLDEWNREGWE